jgi:1,4-alpha-glucan branching enzyme
VPYIHYGPEAEARDKNFGTRSETMEVMTERKAREVTFVFKHKPGVKQVYLVGDFNQWDSTAKRMTKSIDGSYRAKMNLKPGKYQYKFVADGVWINDPEAREQVVNDFGTLNSVIMVSEGNNRA